MSTTNTIEEPATITCHECGSKVPFDDSLGAEIGRKGTWKEVCRECYDDIVRTCQLCGDDDIMPSAVSDFILCKAELSTTCDRPPGIFRVLGRPFMTSSMLGGGWMHHYDVLFIDRLPKHDENYEISGNVCTKCAAPYLATQRKAYGKRPLAKFRFNKRGWELERAHTRATILAHPDMLRDLECDSDGGDDLKDLYDLPAAIPTYHEWIFVEHQGVKVFYAGYKAPDSWMTWRPEPRYRSNGHGKHCFAIGSLPNARRHRDTYVTARAKSLQKMFRRIGCQELDYWRARQIQDGVKSPDDLDYWRKRISHYDTEKAIARDVAIEAIELGYIRQDGTFDAKGKPRRFS